MSVLSCPRAQLLYRLEFLHPPGWLVTAAVLKDTIKGTPVLSSRLLWDLGKPRRAGNNSKFKAGNIQNACTVDISVRLLSGTFQLRSFVVCSFVALLFGFPCYVKDQLVQFIFPVRIVYISSTRSLIRFTILYISLKLFLLHIIMPTLKLSDVTQSFAPSPLSLLFICT
jgi:hypothetical protein